MIGTVLDNRFKITEHLGSGAMGAVYRAIQLSIGRDVAVKVISGMDPTTVKRFFREAQIASALSHPNTVQIIEYGQHTDGSVYLAMELVRGRTLLDEGNAVGPFPARRVCRVGIQLCDALDAAHRQTIVHRDLKPENVMIATDGSEHIKILDFGIARVLGDATSRVTTAGLSAGTPGYMAPEVLGKGAEPEAAQDIYALGVILAELSLGRTLWVSKVIEALYFEKVQNTAVDAVDRPLRAVIKRLMDVDPAKRPTAAQARDLLRELDRAASDPVAAAVHLPMELPLQLELEPEPAPPPTVPGPAPASAPAELELKLEDAWVSRKPRASVGAERVRAEAARTSRATGGGAWPLVVLLLVAGLGAAGYYMFIRKHEPRADPDRHSAPHHDRRIDVRP